MGMGSRGEEKRRGVAIKMEVTESKHGPWNLLLSLLGSCVPSGNTLQ